MKILYSTCYPDKDFDDFVKHGQVLSQAAQKFNKLYVKGFCLNDCDVDVLQFDNNFTVETEEYNGRKIRYLTDRVSGNVIKRILSRSFFIKRIIKEYKKEEPNGIVVIDALCASAYNISKIAKKQKIKVVSIVTDLRGDIVKSGSIKTKIKSTIRNKQFYGQFKYTDYLIILADAMSKKIPYKNSKVSVLNGICDYEIKKDTQPIEKFDKKVVLYTGEIRKMYGIHNLVEAFIGLERNDAELWLYGKGFHFYPELQETIKNNPNVKYMGVRPNADIVIAQKRATLLVNPRLTKGYGSYIKYSFPSKNIEYMISGTPVITTKLPAISRDYDEHLFYFEDESVEGMKKVLSSCLDMSSDEMKQKGSKAREFIFNKLNNKKVTDDILSYFDKGEFV